MGSEMCIRDSVSIAPGKGALGTFAPPLDESGNSVRGQLATKFLSDRLGLNMFASTWVAQEHDSSEPPSLRGGDQRTTD